MHTIPTLLSNGGGLVNALAGGIGLHPGRPVASGSPEVIAAWDAFSMNGLHWVGAAWGGVLAWLIARDLTRDRPSAAPRGARAALPHLLLMAGTARLVVTVLPPIQH